MKGEPILNKAFVFPGQGSQYVGMGRDLYETYPEAKSLFDEADAIMGFPLSKLCFEGSEEELGDTINTQPPCGNGFAAALVVPPLLWVGGRRRRKKA